MIFRKKINRAMEIMGEKNKQYLDSMGNDSKKEFVSNSSENDDSDAKRKHGEFYKEEKINLEKGDFLAIMISAFLTFGPILLLLAVGIVAAWLFLH